MNITLTGFNREDIPIWYKWFNDMEITKYLTHGAFPNTPGIQEEFYKKNIIEKESAIFAIRASKLIGVSSIRNVNWVSRTGDLAVIIGDKDYHKGNFALQAYYLTIDHAFGAMNLNRLFTATMSENKPSLALCKRMGFKDMGVARQAVYKNGEYKDCIYADLLGKEWYEKLTL